MLTSLAATCAFAVPVTDEQAATAAANFAGAGGTMGVTFGGGVSTVRAVAAPDGVTPLRVVKFADGNFIVTSGDTEDEPFLYMSDTPGEMSEEDENPLWALLESDMMVNERVRRESAASQRIKAGAGAAAAEDKWSQWLAEPSGGRVKAGYTTAKPAQSISDVCIPEILGTRWSQSSVKGMYCYNYYTPNHRVCGCVATAMAQTMRHFKWPTASIPKVTVTCKVWDSSQEKTISQNLTTQGGIYDWDMMPLVPEETANFSEAHCKAIGKLTSDVGITVKMSYGEGGSGSNSSKAAAAYRDVWGYPDACAVPIDGSPKELDETTGEAAKIKAFRNAFLPCISAGMPVHTAIERISGYDTKGNPEYSGHAVVTDGYGYSSGKLYIHVNLGWGGKLANNSSTGWYLPSNINKYDCGIYRAVCNISPSTTRVKTLFCGRVKGIDGSPAKNCKVTAVDSSGKKYEAKSNAYGVYCFNVPAGTYSVSATVGHATGSASVTTKAWVKDSSVGHVADVDINLKGDGKFWWTGAKDGKTLSNAGNWEYGKAPGKDAEVIFTKAATVNADVNATFKSVTLNGVVTVNGSLTAKAYAGRENLVVGANATVTLSGDLSVTSDQTHLVRRVDNGGRFVVAGTVKSNGQPVYPTKEAGKGVVVVNGATVDSANWMYATENLVNGNWAVGSGGIAGTGGIWCLSDAKNSASIRPKDSNFTINVPVVIRTNFGRFELNTTGTDGKAHTITLGKSLADDGRLFVAGNGKVVCASTLAGFGDKDPYRGDVEVAGGATLAVKAGKAVTKGAVNILSGATLELPDSASGGVVHGGKVDMKSGSTLVFGGLSAGVVPLTTAQFHVLVDGMSVKFATAPAPGTYTLVKLTSSDSIVQAHLDRIHFADSTLAKRCMLAGVGTKTLVLKVSSTDLVWTGKSGNSWSAAANWLGGKAPSGTCSPYFYEGFIAGSRAVSFDKAYSVTGVLNVEAGTESAPVRFTASGSNGLSLGNKALNIGRTGPAALSVEGGSYGSINGLYLGSSGVSRLYVKSGTLSAAGWTCIGFDDSSKTSDAALVVSGGTFKSTSNNLSIGDKGAPGSKAELKVTGGTCQSAGDIIVGQRGKATLNVNGGTATASGKVVFCNVSGAFGSGEDCAANLNGGVLATKSVTYGSGNANATLTFNGGTLKALADGTLVASNGKLAVKVGKKGGIIDTNGKSVTIAAKLQDAESSGSLSFKGGGTATISGDVTYKCLTSVEAGTGLKSSTAGKTLPGNLTFASGSRLVVGAVNGDYTCFAAKGIVVAGTLNVKVEKTLGGMLPVLTMTGGGKFTQADIANVKVASADGVALVALLSDDAKSICIEPAEPNVWTGAAGNGSMKDAGNWSRKAAPGKNEKVAFRSAATVTADLGSVTLRNVSLGAVVTFNGSLRTKGIDNRANLVVGANATVTLEGDVTMAAGKQYVVRRVDTNGRFVVTGVVKSGGQEFYPTVDAGDGYVVVKGAALDGSKLMFATSDVKNANWAVGASGISGSGAVWCLSNGKNKATFRPQGSDFAINVPTVIRTAFGRYELNTTDLNGTGRTITLGGGYADNGKMFITGKGKVVCSCVPTASNGKGAYSGAVQVEGSATLAVKSGKRLTNGNTKFCAGTSLSLPDSKSGTVELKGLTEFNSGARLVFSGLKSGVTPLKAEKINIYTSNGVGTKVTLSAGGAAPAAGTYTLFTATGQNLIAEHASRLSLDDSALSGYTVTFSLSGDKKSVQVKIAAKAKAGVAAEEAPGSRLQAAFSDWCAAPGNDGSDENAEKAFLKGEGLAEYRPLAVTGIEKVVDGEGLTRFRIRTNSDLTKANGVVYLRYGASFDAMKSVRCVVDGGDVVTEPVEDGGASGAGFFQVCIGFAEPAE